MHHGQDSDVVEAASNRAMTVSRRFGSMRHRLTSRRKPDAEPQPGPQPGPDAEPETGS